MKFKKLFNYPYVLFIKYVNISTLLLLYFIPVNVIERNKNIKYFVWTILVYEEHEQFRYLLLTGVVYVWLTRMEHIHHLQYIFLLFRAIVPQQGITAQQVINVICLILIFITFVLKFSSTFTVNKYYRATNLANIHSKFVPNANKSFIRCLPH